MWAILMNFVLLVNFKSQVMAESNDISSGITSLSLQRTDQPGRYLVKGDFTVKDVQPNQYLKVSWDKALTGINEQRDLKVGDLVVGKLQISDSEAKIYFNQSTKDNHITGGRFSFELIANENTSAWQLKAGKQEVADEFPLQKSSFNKDNKTAIEGFLTKEDEKGLLKWRIRVNLTPKKHDQPIVIQSGLSSDQKLIDIKVKVDNDNYSISEFNKKFAKSKIELVENQLQIKLDQDEFSKQQIEIIQTAKIVDNNTDVFKNFVEIKQLSYKETSKVRNSSINVELYQKSTGKLTIDKVYRSKDGQYKPLSGVEFEVFFKNKFLGRYLTNQNGQIVLNNLELGVYRIREVKAPSFVKFDQEKIWQVELKTIDGQNFLVVNELKDPEFKTTQKIKTSNTKTEEKINPTLFNNEKVDLASKATHSFLKIKKNNGQKKMFANKVIHKKDKDLSKLNNNLSDKDYSGRVSHPKTNRRLPQSGEKGENIVLIGFSLLVLGMLIFVNRLFMEK